MPSSVEAGERLILRIGWFQQPIKVEDLDDFAYSGDLPPNLQLYSPVLNSQVRDLLRNYQIV